MINNRNKKFNKYIIRNTIKNIIINKNIKLNKSYNFSISVNLTIMSIICCRFSKSFSMVISFALP